jgi:hypothetical protein
VSTPVTPAAVEAEPRRLARKLEARTDALADLLRAAADAADSLLEVPLFPGRERLEIWSVATSRIVCRAHVPERLVERGGVPAIHCHSRRTWHVADQLIELS